MRLPRGGGEPTSARSPYGLRTVLAIVALIGGLAGTAWFGLRALDPSRSPPGAGVVTVLCLAVVVTAGADLIVLWRRTRHDGSQDVFHK